MKRIAGHHERSVPKSGFNFVAMMWGRFRMYAPLKNGDRHFEDLRRTRRAKDVDRINPAANRI
jgi:hypothetical protein